MNRSGYVERAGCYNCKHAFVREEHDEAPDYYCHEDGSVRPACMSVAMDERPDIFIPGESRDARRQRVDCWRDPWEQWASVHAVKPWGYCPRWRKYEEGV